MISEVLLRRHCKPLRFSQYLIDPVMWQPPVYESDKRHAILLIRNDYAVAALSVGEQSLVKDQNLAPQLLHTSIGYG